MQKLVLEASFASLMRMAEGCRTDGLCALEDKVSSKHRRRGDLNELQRRCQLLVLTTKMHERRSDPSLGQRLGHARLTSGCDEHVACVTSQ